jgi:hypothetical protein
MADERTWLRELIVASIGAAAVGLIYLVIEKTTARSLYAILAALALAAILLFLVRFFSQKAIVDSYKAKLGSIGISNIYPNYHDSEPVDQLLMQAKTSFDFLGISGRTFFEGAHIDDKIRQRMKEGITFRFLVLNPESPHLAEKALGEGDVPEAWKADIGASIVRIKALQKEVGGHRITVKTYDSPPLWRAFFLDQATAYVNYYSLGCGGKDTPIIVIESSTASLFNPFFGFFKHLWENAKTE